MVKTLKSAVKHGLLVEVRESIGFFGGTDYQLVVDGDIKQQSADLNHIVREFDRY